ncbi:MAG: hypothetical protein ACRD00_01695 [Thermoanaerobaculia bacterium]
MSSHPFDPIAAIRRLEKHRVRFVVIGGFAGRLWGSPSLTNDLDICYDRSRENLLRLAAALKELKARLRGVGQDVPFLLEAKTLEAGDHFTFETRAGNLDVLGFPAGSGGFDQLARTAEEMEIAKGLRVRVAVIEDLIKMKRAAGRPKDLIEVEVLSALQDEIEKE